MDLKSLILFAIAWSLACLIMLPIVSVAWLLEGNDELDKSYRVNVDCKCNRFERGGDI